MGSSIFPPPWEKDEKRNYYYEFEYEHYFIYCGEYCVGHEKIKKEEKGCEVFLKLVSPLSTIALKYL